MLDIVIRGFVSFLHALSLEPPSARARFVFTTSSTINYVPNLFFPFLFLTVFVHFNKSMGVLYLAHFGG